ncbi:hypothetical protein BSZ35_08065 [Salinibacter sp. 10B]|nr:hypothetical protein BSZ35_08065 [Salinibacter sp. 10B]
MKRSSPTVSAATLHGPQLAKSQIPADLRIGETRAQAVRASSSEMGMTHADEPLTVEQVAQHFHRARRADVQDQATVHNDRRDGARWKGNCRVQLCTPARDAGRAGEFALLRHVAGTYAT